MAEAGRWGMGEGEKGQGKDIEGGGQPPGEGIAAEPIVDEARAERAERGHRAGGGEEQAHEAARVLASEKSVTMTGNRTETPPYEKPKSEAAR